MVDTCFVSSFTNLGKEDKTNIPTLQVVQCFIINARLIEYFMALSRLYHTWLYVPFNKSMLIRQN